jgi:hypothetical protein
MSFTPTSKIINPQLLPRLRMSGGVFYFCICLHGMQRENNTFAIKCSITFLWSFLGTGIRSRYSNRARG